ncbi:MAG: hypothetical protein MI802_01210, partial [Desulfobacterales bacterium]|nr:hypothetical protein [Desulfobacterales bacterium]
MTEQPSVILCPYCGNAQTEPRDRCTACGGHFDELSLKATQGHMGPWFVRDRANPFRPGCSYEVLVKEIERGRVTATTILRGPTTRQFWSIAQNVPGVAHHLGYCHACGKTVKPGSSACEHCGEVFFAPTLKDNLGLAPAGTPVRLPQNEAAPVEQTPPVAPTDPDYPVAEAAATREARAWMTSQQQKPDTLDTAESPIAPTIQESRS